MTSAHAPAVHSPGSPPRRAVAAYVRDSLLFTACYVALDWASYIHPLGPFNITPWNPPPGLSIVWLALGGLRYAPAVFAAAFLADIAIRGAPGGVGVTALTSFVLAGGYAATATALVRAFRFDPRLRDTGQVWRLLAVAAIGASVVAVLYVGVLWGAGFVVRETFAHAALRFWLGDVVGVLVTAPLLLVAADPERRERIARTWRRPATLLRMAVMVVAVGLIFEGAADEPSRYFYVLFLPLIWIALRGGLTEAAAASAIVQAGVVVGAHIGTIHSLAVVELQALVAAMTLTGLFLGAMVDERERAEESLRQSLRLAAAGEMAGAIAHEINQPLAALGNYGRACQLMLERGGGAAARDDLDAAIASMLAESRRAAEVVARLREFFRTGTTRLEVLDVADVLAGARRVGAKLREGCDVEFTVEGTAGGPPLYADRMQVELVLRNLIANAFESVAQQDSGPRRVAVTARREADRTVRFSVSDTGGGVAPHARARLFAPFHTTKPSGMGLGLAISRAIAEAHGGSLEPDAKGAGTFDLVLPETRAHE